MKMELNFIGKDSVAFNQTYEIPDDVGNVLKEIIGNRNKEEQIFEASSGDVNKFLKGCFDFMTPKLFRTAWGTKLLMEELQKNLCTKDMTTVQKQAVYKNAALEVSKKLNHQKNVAKNYNEQVQKVDDKIENAKEKNNELTKKVKEELLKIKKEIQTAKKCLTGERLEEKLSKLKTKKEKLQIRLEKSKSRIEKLEIEKDFKKSTKNIAIGTAMSNYSSPAAAFSWCKDNDVDIKFIYPKGLREKYSWAENTQKDYWRKFPNV